MKKFIALIMLTFGVSLLWAWWALVSYMNNPNSMTEYKNYTVQPGLTLKRATTQLEQMRVISNSRWLYYYARALRKTDLKAGDYEFEPGINPKQVLDKLLSGKVRLNKITIPEGWNTYEIGTLLEKKSIVSRKEFLAACNDKQLLATLKIKAPSCEGFMFPDTYRFAKNINASTVIEKMAQQFKANFTEKIQKLGAQQGLTKLGVVTLASIIQKETAALHEMPIISRVFHNRLAKGMRLGTDPTVIYAEWMATGVFDGDISYADLRRKHPYNTYTTGGLPPGPIANPGVKALEAAVSPKPGEQLYFVSNNNGEHIFCPNLACHNKAVEKWQRQYFKKKKK